MRDPSTTTAPSSTAAPRDPGPTGGRELLRPMTAGVISALVAFTSSFVVVLGGLEGVGASPEQAASGLLAVSVLMGAGTILLTLMTRLPITVAWSTPGAALLATSAAVQGGWSAAVGAFLLVGVLIMAAGLVPQLAAVIARIPAPVAQAMLAGVLLHLCLGPVQGVVDNPWAVLPIVLVWLAATRFLPRAAAPLAFVVAVVVIVVDMASRGVRLEASSLLPVLELTTPTLSVGAVVGVALPLFVVTMASQNVPGVAVMRGLGYTVPWRPSMLVTGAGTALGAAAGGYAVNLAAISAALAAGPEAGADRSRRWIASLTNGVVAVLLGVGAAGFAQLVGLAPDGVIPAVAGLALIGTFAASLKAALADGRAQLPAAGTFLVAASGISVAGVSAAFWSLVAGIVLHAAVGRLVSSQRPRGTRGT